MQILIRFQIDGSGFRIPCISVFHQEVHKECEEEYEESNCIAHQLNRGTTLYHIVLDIVDVIEQAKHACQEEHGKSKNQVPWVEQCIESVAGICPPADDRLHAIGKTGLFDDEVRAVKEGGHSTSDEQRPKNSIQYEAPLECLRSKEIAQFVLELIADSLQDKREKYNQPQPIGPSETCTIEQRERCEESTSKRHQCCERQFPLSPSAVDEHSALFRFVSQTEYQRVSSLHKHQED